MFVKRFLEWFGVKEKLDSNDYSPPLVNEGDLWWCAVGENIGVESSGKGRNFTRPVVVVKRFGRLSFFGIPVTTAEHEGSWYVLFKHKDVDEVAMLAQARTLSYKRLDRKIGRLNDEDFKKIKEAFCGLFYQ